jgi:hypothetical protein
MAPHIKLIYVDAKALAEPIRFLFAYGNIHYDDFRMTHEDFKSDKSSKLFERADNLFILMYVLLACLGFPYNKIPNVEIDGKLVHQSMAIARYFAKQVGLAGNSMQEELLIDMAVDTLADYRHRKLWPKAFFCVLAFFIFFFQSWSISSMTPMRTRCAGRSSKHSNSSCLSILSAWRNRLSTTKATWSMERYACFYFNKLYLCSSTTWLCHSTTMPL